MSRMEERAVVALVRAVCRPMRTGYKIMLAGAGVAAVCAIPLLLYIVFGPADGNPIGLGLLFALGVVVAQVAALLGAVSLAVDYLIRRGGS